MVIDSIEVDAHPAGGNEPAVVGCGHGADTASVMSQIDCCTRTYCSDHVIEQRRSTPAAKKAQRAMCSRRQEHPACLASFEGLLLLNIRMPPVRHDVLYLNFAGLDILLASRSVGGLRRPTNYA